MPQTFWFSLYIHLFSDNLCLSTRCCQEQSDVPDDYSLAKIPVHFSQSSIYNLYSSIYKSLLSIKLPIAFRLWACRTFTDTGIHQYSQKQCNAFTISGAGRAMAPKEVQYIYFFCEAGAWERSYNFTGTKSFSFT